MDQPLTIGVQKPRKADSRRGTGENGADKGAEHPIAGQAGIFRDDPLWDDCVDAMRRARLKKEAMKDVPG